MHRLISAQSFGFVKKVMAVFEVISRLEPRAGARLSGPMIEVRRLTGEAIRPYLGDLATLRIQVFREFPYLYDGSDEYESEYLESYASSLGGVIVLALDGAKVVGVSTGLPLAEADASFQRPFMEAGIPIEKVFYLGESVLAREYRGRGIGHRFFDEREAHAAALGYEITSFCAVERPADHPLCPPDYRPNDPFWTKRGYGKRPELQTRLSWKQVDAPDEVENVLTFRMRTFPLG
ncbi:GNAT family N-acetyltransferase [Luteolibacter ambystomatis]|uniref:GNAT family N-acetyltransferase n=1 Tax=Luteolibacter ambystomatis TaxID=2824561 RepID=A0A975J1T7_9BACT|nr:GNAT family N-acetyltransferase [Luteolibacter ambystomatis]QUE52471.1 GNAT family N-acetyltransferase [Luteolibacter ambystomatis]